jgi:hypothetical protein
VAVDKRLHLTDEGAKLIAGRGRLLGIPAGDDPTGTVATTALVVVSMTETVLLSKFVT